MPWFRKHHSCPCGTDWWEEWDCLCNDRCPTCDAEIEPDVHETIQGDKSAKIRTLNDWLTCWATQASPWDAKVRLRSQQAQLTVMIA
jgi:hypothetical protein